MPLALCYGKSTNEFLINDDHYLMQNNSAINLYNYHKVCGYYQF